MLMTMPFHKLSQERTSKFHNRPKKNEKAGRKKNEISGKSNQNITNAENYALSHRLSQDRTPNSIRNQIGPTKMKKLVVKQ